jgi:hypothetical protein
VRFLLILVTLFQAGLATSVSSACSLVFSPMSVGSSFKVKVSGYDGPVKGLLLKLNGPQGPTLSAVTDDKGIAEFSNAPPGALYLGADHDNGYGAQLDVKPNGPTNVIVPMRWPSIEPIHVRSLSGTVRAPGAIPGQPDQSVLSLELLEGVSGAILSSISTSTRGEFDFGKPRHGLYFIRVKPYPFGNQQVGGLISVAVHPIASDVADKLDLNLNWTSCGLMYTDQSQCSYPDLHVDKLAVHLADSIGRPVFGGAEVFLLDAAQNQVARASTGASGNFSFPGPLVGTFQLRVEGGAFTPVHTPIHFEPTAGSSSLEIEAASLGCSTVRVK